ncbi:MAG: extracellular solute-binding protein [Phycisphaerae bacterium]|nr:extracellular solute-binding protein [Phycisphaerae bacterium]
MLHRNIVCRAVLAAGLLAAAIGCQSKQEDQQVIRVVRNIGGREGFRLHWEAWKAAFERDNPGWSLELINVGDNNGSAFYQTRIATNDLPEVIQTWAMTEYLADNGHLVPLPDEYYEKFGVALPPAYKGKRYATVGGLQVMGMAVNRKMWASIGVTEPPATWEAFLDALAKLKAAGHKPLTYGAREWPAAVPLGMAIHTNLYDYRGEVYDESKPSWTRRRNAGEVRFATDPVAMKIMRNMIQLLATYADKGVLSDGYSESQSEFYQGKTATWLMGCWIGGDLQANKVPIEIEYWPIPSMTGRKPIFITGSFLQSGWAMTTTAKGPKRAKALAALEALYDPKVYQLWLNAEAQLATAKNVPPVTGPQSDWPASKAFYANMAGNIDKHGVTRGAMVDLDDQPPLSMEDSYMRVMQDILTGERDVGKLLGKLDAAWESGRKSEK